MHTASALDEAQGRLQRAATLEQPLAVLRRLLRLLLRRLLLWRLLLWRLLLWRLLLWRLLLLRPNRLQRG